MTINWDMPISNFSKRKEPDWVVKGPTQIYFRITGVYLRQGRKGPFFSIKGKFHEEAAGEGWASLLVNTKELVKHPVLKDLIQKANDSYDHEYISLKGKELVINGGIYKGKQWTNRDGNLMDNYTFSRDSTDIKLYNGNQEEKI